MFLQVVILGKTPDKTWVWFAFVSIKVYSVGTKLQKMQNFKHRIFQFSCLYWLKEYLHVVFVTWFVPEECVWIWSLIVDEACIAHIILIWTRIWIGHLRYTRIEHFSFIFRLEWYDPQFARILMSNSTWLSPRWEHQSTCETPSQPRLFSPAWVFEAKYYSWPWFDQSKSYRNSIVISVT